MPRRQTFGRTDVDPGLQPALYMCFSMIRRTCETLANKGSSPPVHSLPPVNLKASVSAQIRESLAPLRNMAGNWNYAPKAFQREFLSRGRSFAVCDVC
jgi:hypothetical protein